jgi:hypothetical protein
MWGFQSSQPPKNPCKNKMARGGAVAASCKEFWRGGNDPIIVETDVVAEQGA